MENFGRSALVPVTLASNNSPQLPVGEGGHAGLADPAFNRGARSGMVVRLLRLVKKLIASPVRRQIQYRW